MKTQRKHSHLVNFMSAYYERIDHIAALKEEAAMLKSQILEHADPGKYGRYSISRVAKQLIHVRAYTRNAYSVIRRAKH